MGNGWHEWPLMIFTVFGQCVAGGFIVLALALLRGRLSREQEKRVVLSMFGLWRHFLCRRRDRLAAGGVQ